MMETKIIKKYLLLVVAILISIPSFVFATDAKTLRELRQELSDYQTKYNQAQEKKKEAQSEINSNNVSISKKQTEIAEGQQQVIDATNESAKLTTEIEEGKDELTNLMEAYQIASGDNVYLEYIFEATSYEDLVYRYAVIDEIMSYVDDKINDYEDKITQNNALKVYLAQKETQLNSQIDSLADEIEDLNDDVSSYNDVTLSVSKEIESTQSLIKSYVSMGCKEDEDLDQCASVLGDTKFIRPLNKGVITSYYAYRTSPITGKTEYHSGNDIAGNPEGTPVYAIANGQVGKIVYHYYCGGNMVYIYHIVNGKKYTSFYYHLLSVNVSIGQRVTNQTVIGTVGGGSGTSSWETCSTGAHLHLGAATGWYGRDYVSSSEFKAHLIDSRTIVSIPNRGTWFYSRY